MNMVCLSHVYAEVPLNCMYNTDKLQQTTRQTQPMCIILGMHFMCNAMNFH